MHSQDVIAGEWWRGWWCLFLWSSDNIYELRFAQFFFQHKVFSKGRKIVISSSERKQCDIANVLTLFFFPSSLGFLELDTQKITVLWFIYSPETRKQWDKVSETSCWWQCSIKWKKPKKKEGKRTKRYWNKATQKNYCSYSWIIWVIVFHM